MEVKLAIGVYAVTLSKNGVKYRNETSRYIYMNAQLDQYRDEKNSSLYNKAIY